MRRRQFLAPISAAELLSGLLYLEKFVEGETTTVCRMLSPGSN